MKILSVDTASLVCSVCILEDMDVIYHKKIENGLTHSEKLLPMIKEAFDATSLNLSDIDLYACSTGPGSFTGIRIGISTLKAFIDVYDKPSIGISSLEGLSYNLDNNDLTCCLIDARNQNVYCGIFKDHIQVGDLEFDHIDNICNSLKDYSQENITFVGDASAIYKDQLEKVFTKACFADEEQNKSNAISIAKAAFMHYKKGEENLGLSPLYLRKSQAERLLEEGK